MNNKKDKEKNASKDPGNAPEATSGKKAIDANLKANGKDPHEPSTRDAENKDAENWRNEG